MTDTTCHSQTQSASVFAVPSWVPHLFSLTDRVGYRRQATALSWHYWACYGDMVVDPKYAWTLLALACFYFTLAIFIMLFKRDTFMVPFYLTCGVLEFGLWISTYSELSSGVLTNRIFFYPFRRFNVAEITHIEPHRKNGKWGYGTVVNIYVRSGKKITLQPKKPEPFMTTLRQ